MPLKDKTVIAIEYKTRDRINKIKFGKGESYDSVLNYIMDKYEHYCKLEANL